MARLYSKRLLSSDFATGPINAVVPAGYIWVVRDIDLMWFGPPENDQASVSWEGVGQIFQCVGEASVEQHFQWQGRQVGNAGDTLQFLAEQYGNWTALVSGYELSTP